MNSLESDIAFIIALKSIVLSAILMYDLDIDQVKLRSPRKKAGREEALEFVDQWDDITFKRQTRLEREDFNALLKIISPELTKNNIKSRNASCGGLGVIPKLMLLITLRILAGASYLDMIWYRISSS